jgi:hypothetical protein
MSDMRLAVIVEAIDQLSAPFRRMAEAASLPARAVRQGFMQIQEGIEKLSSNYTGLAAAVGAGFELREVIKAQDEFQRLGIDAGISAEHVEELHQRVFDAAQRMRVPLDELTAGFHQVFDLVGIESAEADIGALAAGIQRLGGHGADLGALFGTLERFSGLRGPDDLIRAMAVLREQVGPHAEWLADFARVAPELLAAYRMQGITGIDAVRDVGALYATIRPAVPRPLAAATEVQAILDAVSDVNKAAQLQGLGIHVLGRTPAEANANILTRTRRPLSEYLPELLKAYQTPQAAFLLDQILGPGIRDALAKATPADLTAALGASGSPAKFLGEASQDAQTLGAALNGLATAITRVTESYLASPLQKVADLINAYPGLVASAVAAFAGLAIFGVAAGWAMNLVRAGVMLSGWIIGAVSLIGDLVVALRAGYGVFTAIGLAAAANPLGAFLLAAGALALVSYEIYEHWDKIAAIWDRLSGRGQPAGPSLFTDDSAARKRVDDMLGPGAYDRIDAENARRWGGVQPLGSGAAGAAPGAKATAEVTVRLENAPPGTRVTSKRSDPGTDVNLDLGYAMGLP